MTTFAFNRKLTLAKSRRFCASRALETSLHSSCIAVARLKNRLLDPDLKDGVIETPEIQFLIVNIPWLQPGVPLRSPNGCACALEKIFSLSGATTDAIFLERDDEACLSADWQFPPNETLKWITHTLLVRATPMFRARSLRIASLVGG